MRDLTNAVLDNLFAGPTSDPLRYSPLSWLITSSTSCRDVVGDEIDKRIAAMVGSPDPATHLDGLRLAVWLPYASWGAPSIPSQVVEGFWDEWAKERAQTYYSAIIAAAETSMEMRYAALLCGLITTEHALKMPGGILPLVQVQPTGIFEINWAPHLVSKVVQMAQGASYSSAPKACRRRPKNFPQ